MQNLKWADIAYKIWNQLSGLISYESFEKSYN